MQIIAIALIALAGGLLGLLGGGGSLLILPILLYVVRVPFHDAVASSLLIVGSASLLTTVLHARHKHVRWGLGLTTGAFSISSSWLFAKIAPKIPSGALLVGFALIMIATAIFMLIPRFRAPDTKLDAESSTSHGTTYGLWSAILVGIVVGALTGTVGAGGGFLLVPALLSLGLSIPEAVGTSSWVIALNSFSGFSGYLPNIHIDVALSSILIMAAMVGAFGGAGLAPLVPHQVLRKAFGMMVLMLGFLLLLLR